MINNLLNNQVQRPSADLQTTLHCGIRDFLKLTHDVVMLTLSVWVGVVTVFGQLIPYWNSPEICRGNSCVMQIRIHGILALVSSDPPALRTKLFCWLRMYLPPVCMFTIDFSSFAESLLGHEPLYTCSTIRCTCTSRDTGYTASYSGLQISGNTVWL